MTSDDDRDRFEGRVYDPDVDSDEPRALSSDERADFEREMAAIEQAFPDSDEDAPDAKELTPDREVIATKGDNAVRAAVVAKVPKRADAPIMVVKKVVERSRLVQTQPAIRPIVADENPSERSHAPSETIADEPPKRGGIGWWIAGVGALTVAGVAIAWGAANTTNGTEPSTAEPSSKPPATAARTARSDDAGATIPPPPTSASTIGSGEVPMAPTTASATSTRPPISPRVPPPRPPRTSSAAAPPSSKPAASSIFIHESDD